MNWWFSQHSDVTFERCVAAFPSRLAADARAALKALPKAEHEPTGEGSIEMRISGEPVRIPYRVYFPQPPARTLEALSRPQRLVVAALLTRHQDGHVRERWVAELLTSPESWVPAFVVPLLGEYVITRRPRERGQPRVSANVGQPKHMTTDDVRSLFEELRGEQLSAVTFVQDYLQLWFDGPGVNVTNPLTVSTPGSTITSWDPGFRDLLCGQITKIVAGVEWHADEALTFRFEHGSAVSVSLRKEDYRSAEAFYAHGFKNNGWYAA